MHSTSTAALLLFALGAPKLPTTCEFVSHKAWGGNGIVNEGPNGMDGATILRVDFVVRGPAGKYVVEFWVEAGTGEKAVLIDRTEVTIPASGMATGKFDRHTCDIRPGQEEKAEKEGKLPLPPPLGYYWSYRLILKRSKDDPVADTGVEMVPFEDTLSKR